MKPELYTRIYLVRDVPEENLKQGDIAYVIDYLPHPQGGEEGAILEIFNALGKHQAIATVPVSAIAALNENQRMAVRPLAQAA